MKICSRFEEKCLSTDCSVDRFLSGVNSNGIITPLSEYLFLKSQYVWNHLQRFGDNLGVVEGEGRQLAEREPTKGFGVVGSGGFFYGLKDRLIGGLQVCCFLYLYKQ